jgi:hypothetical protein
MHCLALYFLILYKISRQRKEKREKLVMVHLQAISWGDSGLQAMKSTRDISTQICDAYHYILNKKHYFSC